MFNWLFNGVADAILSKLDPKTLGSLLRNVLNEDETQKYIIDFTDALFQRYSQKILGGAVSKDSSSVGSDLPQFFNKKGQFNLKGVVPYILSRINQNKGQEPVGRLP